MNGAPDIDTQLCVAVQNSDYLAFERLFQKYYEVLCRYAKGLLADNGRAEDVVQETFIYFWECRDRIEVKDSVRSYLYTSVRHRALRMLQKQLIEQKHNSRLTEFVEYLLSSEYSVEEEQEMDRVKAVMRELPPQCLKVFLMSTLEKKKYAEIAEELSISVNTVKTHVAKAYRLIREQLRSKRSLTLFFLLAGQNCLSPVEQNQNTLSIFVRTFIKRKN